MTMPQTENRKNETGAALITILMLVSVMSAIAVSAMDQMNVEVRRFVGEKSLVQAREYALAAEIVAVKKAQEFVDNAVLFSTLGLNTEVGRITVPVDNGSVSGRLSENSNCFNLNSLVQLNDAGKYTAHEEARLQYIRLLNGLGLGDIEARSLAAALTDWQDSDNRPLVQGAEDAAYSLLKNPYRANNHPIMDIREMRLIRGYNPSLIKALKPFVCMEDSLVTALNINSLEADKALLIPAVLGGEISLNQALRLIDERPASGYENAADFWRHEVLKDRTIEQKLRAQIGFKPHRFYFVVDVKILDYRQRYSAMIKIHPDGSHQLSHRQFGA